MLAGVPPVELVGVDDVAFARRMAAVAGADDGHVAGHQVSGGACSAQTQRTVDWSALMPR